MFSLFRRPRRRLQLYGKLPIAKDYLRIGLGGELGMGWRAWLDQNFSTGLGSGQKRRLTHPVGFLLGHGGQSSLLGCLWNSSDAGGQRAFPFSMCLAHRQKRSWKKVQAADRELLASFAFLEGMRAAALACTDRAQLMEELRKAEVDPLPAIDAASANIELDSWSQALWPGQGLQGLRQDLEALGLVDASEIKVIRIPLLSRFDEFQQLQTWMRLLETHALAGRGRWPNLFLQRLPKGEAQSARLDMFVSLRPLCAADASLLCEPAALESPEDELRLGSAEAYSDPGSPLAPPAPAEQSLLPALLRALGQMP